MKNQESMQADDYYKDYLKQTSNQNNNKSAKIIIGLLSTIVIGGGYYIWQQKKNVNLYSAEKQKEIEHIRPKIKITTMQSPSNPLNDKRETIIQKVSSKSVNTTQKSSKVNIATKAMIIPNKMIEKKKNNVEKRVSLSSIDTNKTSKDNQKINDLAHSLLSGISKNNIKQKSTKIDTFNKIVIKEENTSLQKQQKSISIAKKLSLVLQNTKKEKNTYTKALKIEAQVRVDEMQYVVVKKGDTLFYIAKRIYGDAMKYPIIFDANPDILNDPARISIGQKLRVPKLKESKS